MSVEWTVTFKKSELTEKALELLENFDHEVFFTEDRIDMEENEFFNFESEAHSHGTTLPVDGGGSWGKHVKY